MTDESEAERRGLDDGGQDFGKIAWRVRAAGTDRSSFEVPSRAQPGHIFQFRYSRTLKGCDYYRCSDCTAAAAGDQRLLLKKTVRVRDAMLLSDPERPGGAAHLCLMPAQQRPRPPKRRHSTPDSDEETSYGAAVRVHASVVAYYSRDIGHTLYFKYLGESRKQPGAQEFFCIGCAERDASYDFRVFVRDEQFVVLDPNYSDREHICRYDGKPSTETVRKYADADWHDEALRRAEVLPMVPKPPSGPQGDPTPPHDATWIGNPSIAPTGLMIPQDRRIEASAPMTPIGGAPTAAEFPLKKACHRLLADVRQGVDPDVSASTEESDAGNGPEGSHDNTASSQSDVAAEPKVDVGSPDASSSSDYSAYVELEETNSDVFDPAQCLSKIENDELMKIDFNDADMPSTSERSRRCHPREDIERRRMNESCSGDSVASVAISVNTTACREALGIESPVDNVDEAQGADQFESVDQDGFVEAQQAAGPTSSVVATAEMSTGIHPASTNDDEDARSTAADTADTSQSAAHTETGTTESHKKKGRIVFDESDEDESDDSDEENDDEAASEDDDADSDVEYMGITKAEPGSIGELSSRRRHRSGQTEPGPPSGNSGPSRPAFNIPSTTFGPAKYSDDGQLAYFTDILGHTYTLELLGKKRAVTNQRLAEVRTYQCMDCRQALLLMGDYRPIDLPKIKVVDGFFTDIDPGRPQNNPHFCTQQLPNGENFKSCE